MFYRYREAMETGAAELRSPAAKPEQPWADEPTEQAVVAS